MTRRAPTPRHGLDEGLTAVGVPDFRAGTACPQGIPGVNRKIPRSQPTADGQVTGFHAVSASPQGGRGTNRINLTLNQVGKFAKHHWGSLRRAHAE